ncbi:superoxide dismutase family protein [Sandarakinorhabdus oryzae]|uniref:superoxide dismutase family protein n=1 Tax=Sandarakinorhabdus oryzae TaxID=2675220 RepID=UPI0012E30487|nr:superoxide dismutase family protein [Sandarakinorhabdus oryzae]
MSAARRLALILPVLALAACGPKTESLGKVGGAPPSLILATRLLTPDGNSLGEAELLQMAGGVQLIATVKGLPAGQYGMHLHAVGRCVGPDFASAGPHFNPMTRQHGRDNPMGAHMGDLPNLEVSDKGVGEVNIMLTGLRLVDGDAPLLDADGAAVVLHAKPDDYRTDPAGNAGSRIACGEVKRQ